MLSKLAHLPRLDDLAKLAVSVAQPSRSNPEADVLREAEALALRHADADTPYGNVIELLQRGPETEAERELVISLLARGLATSGNDETRLREALLWLSNRTTSLSATTSKPATVQGEQVSPPRGPVALVFLGMTGLLLLGGVAKILGRLVLAYRRPVELRLTQEGIAVRARTQLLGRVLREREMVIPLAGLSQATREVRYPGLPLYLGMIALAAGSYVGMGLVTDGLRAASMSMVGAGSLLVLMGVGLDMLSSSLFPGRAGRCRMLLVPKRGPRVCVGSIDIATADRLLEALK